MVIIELINLDCTNEIIKTKPVLCFELNIYYNYNLNLRNNLHVTSINTTGRVVT